ncbi:256_t:CDS:2, partial [Dentiscutata heterogama]
TNNLYETEIYNTSLFKDQDISDNNMVTNIATTSSNTNIDFNVPVTLNKKKTRSKISDIRSYFKPKTTDAKEINCKFCQTLFSKTTDTSNLHKHLDSQHLVKKIRNFVNVISSSSSITQDFKELEQSVGEAYITMHTTIVAVIRYNKNLTKFKLTPQEETNLQVTTQFLKLFYETTNIPSSSNYITLNIAILLIDDIVDNILLCIQNPASPKFLKEAATQMFKKIQKYTNEIYDKTAFIAAILDP